MRKIRELANGVFGRLDVGTKVSSVWLPRNKSLSVNVAKNGKFEESFLTILSAGFLKLAKEGVEALRCNHLNF